MKYSEEKEITFILYNYPEIDKIIEKRKLELIEQINVGNDAWQKSKTYEDGTNTIEDIVEKFEDDYEILRLNKWNNLIDKFLIQIINDDKLYNYVCYKYFQRKSKDEIIDILKIDKKKYLNLDLKLKKMIYLKAQKEGLFNEQSESSLFNCPKKDINNGK